MFPHHLDSIAHYVRSVERDPGVLSVILGGSLAKGTETATSDIDLMVILSPERYQEHLSQNKIFEGVTEGITYEHGYYDIKYFPKDYLIAAVRNASEPTRTSFIGAREILTRDQDIAELLRAIPVYPRHEKAARLQSFFAAYEINKMYFWGESAKNNNLYLRLRSASDIVLFGLRLILTLNETLFSSHKWLLRTVAEVQHKPPEVIALAERFLAATHEENKVAFCQAIDHFVAGKVDMDFVAMVSWFILDHEQWWYASRPHIAEW